MEISSKNVKSLAHERALEALPFWPALSVEERAAVISRYRVVRYKAGTIVRGGNEDCLGFIIMLGGVFRAYLLSPDGREMTLYNIRAGEACIMSAACVLDAVSFETHIDAVEDSEALLVPLDVFSSLVSGNVHVECYVYKMATERFSDVVTGVERLVFLNIEQRIASFLLDEASMGDGVTVNKTHAQIALDIGSAREVVSRALKSMERRELVQMFRGGVSLTDKAAMYKLIS